MMRLRLLQLMLILMLSYCASNAINSIFLDQNIIQDEERLNNIAVDKNRSPSKKIPVLFIQTNQPHTIMQKISKEGISCVADMAYKEAVGEPLEGRMAVIHVAFNRMENQNFPSRACEVIYQRNGKVCQYSWACEPPARRRIARESKEYKELVLLVKTIASVSNRHLIDPTKGSLYFKKEGFYSAWFSENLRRVKTIGGHEFFVEG